MSVTPGLFSGVTIVYSANEGAIMESSYYLDPINGLIPVNSIRLGYNRPVSLDKNGNLVVTYENGTIMEATPVAWQEINGQQQPVTSAYVLYGNNEVGFSLGKYVPGVPVVIDPVLTWNTFLGGSGNDWSTAIAVDGSGNVYVGGWSDATWGTNPVRGFTSVGSGTSYNIFAAKLDSGGNLLWNTFLGNSPAPGAVAGTGIAVDSIGNVYVAGTSTATWGAPVVPYTSGNENAFAAQLNSSGVVQWNTFLAAGGTSGYGNAIAVDISGVYVAGTNTTSGDAFVAEVSSSGDLQWATSLGNGTLGKSQGNAIAVEGGNIYVAGSSQATWQGTNPPVQAHTTGTNYDAFVAEVNGSGAIQWNTFLGSAGGSDYGTGIAVDSNGNVYVVGYSNHTWGANPVVSGPMNQENDAFAAKLDSGGNLQWNTFMGSEGSGLTAADEGEAIALDGSGNVYISGYSGSTWGKPVWAFTSNANEAFAVELDNNGNLQWNTFLGGSAQSQGYAIAVEGVNVYVGGYSWSTWGASTVRPFTGSNQNAFAADLGPNPATLTTANITVTGASTAQAGVQLSTVLAPTDTTATYVWETDASGSYLAISGATESTYTPAAGDVGHNLEVMVTIPATDATYAASSATSSPTAAVLATYALTMAVSPSGEGTATDQTGTSPYIAGAQVSIEAVANAGYQFVNWTAPSGTITSATSATTTFTMPANAVTVTANFEIIPPATYALTMAVSPSGEGTATDETGTSPYIAGAQVSIKAAANAGYQFVNWTAPSGTITSATSATTTFTMPANAITVTANFEIIPPATYALTMAVSPSGEGTATDQTGTSPYIAGAQVSIKAAANAGYQFVNWTAPSGTITSATSATTTFTMPANAVTVTANFEIIPPATYALTMAVSPSGEGTATDETGTSPYIAGAQVSIKAAANAGYQFVNWTAPSGTITSATSATTTFTMPANAVTVTANFEIIPPATYALTMAVSPSGEGTATDQTGTSPYIAGAQVSIKAAANAGYQFVNWTAPSGTITSATSATTTFTMPANAVTVTANFEIIPPATYALTMAVSPSGEGTATDQTGTSPYIAGAQVSIEAVANAGYQFVNWTAPSGTITSATSATTTFTMPANAVTVTANFEIIPPATYALTMAVSPSGEGTATDETGTSPYIAGAQVSIKAAANAGYQFVNWTAPSGTITSATSATTTFTMPANAITVTANFEIIPPATYALTMAVSPSGEGTATDQTGTSPYIAGAQVSIKAAANAGYQFVNWTAPSGTITSATSATTTFTMPANAVTVTANFEIIPPATYALTMAVSPSGEGTATDETGTSPYIAGAQVSIKAAANAGYQFVNWTAPSGTITSATSATTTFTMPANAVTVTANFEIIPPATYALTMAVSPSGEGTATDQTGTSPYIAGAQVSIKAAANAGYQFVNWTAPSGTITSATSATTTFTMPANAVTVTANFEIIPPATYALTMAVSPSGEGTATDQTGTSPYIAGAQVSIKAAANAGYQFVNWTAPSGTITSATSATTTFTMPANAVTVTANFEIIPPATYALTMAVSPSGEGTATDQTGTSPYIAGAQVSIKAVANAGYQFVNWTAPSGTITSATSATTTFTMPANAVTVTANFEIIPTSAGITVGKGSTVGSGSSLSGVPYVEASWVQEPDNNITLWNGDTSTIIAEHMESGDPIHVTPGTQINPPMIFDSSKTIDFYTVVGDPDGIGSLSDVYGYVYSPSNSPAPYNTPTDPNGNPFFKYKVTYTNLGNGPAAQALVTAAYNAGLIAFGTVPTTGNDQYATSETWTGSYTLSNLVNSSGTGELQKNVADLYMGQGVLTYEQPAGQYNVDVYAEDTLDYVSPALMNPFTYVALTGVETDFTSINYGAVALKIDKTIAGDVTWNSPAGVNNATVRNIGNTWTQVTVAQDDEGFGVDGTEAPMAYVDTTPPTFSSTPTSGVSTNWNVYFDACMGSNGANAEMYYTPTAKGSPMTNVVTLPGVLGLSTMNELDFSIYINDGNGSHSGSMTISSVYVPFGAAGATANGGGVVTVEPPIISTPITPSTTTTTKTTTTGG